MPIYEYRCGKCGEFEAMQRISDKPLTRCPTCGRKVTKLISSTSFQLKGSGWYVTDYARKSGAGAKESGEKGGKESAEKGGKETAAKDRTKSADKSDQASAKSESSSTESKSGGKSKGGEKAAAA